MNLPAREPARAKVNLNLAIVGRDASGYHLLETLMAFANGAEDLLTLELGDTGDTLLVQGPFAADVPGGDDNLVLRATRLVRDAAPKLPGVRWTLDKVLPVAAGIGGGSADAGAALRLLGRAFDLDASMLSAVALKLGADVPAAFHDRAVWATGRGEVLAPVTLPPLAGLLVNPRVACDTPSVFQAYRDAGIPFSRSSSAPAGWRTSHEAFAWCAGSGNDLLAPASTLVPAVADVMTAIAAIAECRFGSMSGSGATCFGLFQRADAASRAAKALAIARPDWWVQSVAIG